jgi:hypothetical protein
MKISNTPPVRPSSSTTRKKDAGSLSSTSSTDFLDILGGTESAGSTASAPPISDIQPLNTVGALLSLQEMPEDEVRNRRAFSEGKSAIETLEQLRDSLLAGSISPNMLRTLQRHVETHKGLNADPKLAEILNDIELRTAVELAKLEQATNKNSQ